MFNLSWSEDGMKKNRDAYLESLPWVPAQNFTWNPRAGWREDEHALRSVIQAAVDLGVQYITATISQISFDASGACLGAQTPDGPRLTAECTVWCTGAHTAQLIADSAPDRPGLQVSGRLVAAFRVTGNEMSEFQDAPILVKAQCQVKNPVHSASVTTAVPLRCFVNAQDKLANDERVELRGDDLDMSMRKMYSWSLRFTKSLVCQ